MFASLSLPQYIICSDLSPSLPPSPKLYVFARLPLPHNITCSRPSPSPNIYIICSHLFSPPPKKCSRPSPSLMIYVRASLSIYYNISAT